MHNHRFTGTQAHTLYQVNAIHMNKPDNSSPPKEINHHVHRTDLREAHYKEMQCVKSTSHLLAYILARPAR